MVRTLCGILDELRPAGAPHDRLLRFVTDRPGHDRRYAIDMTRIERELGWTPSVRFEEGIRRTVQWYLDNAAWVDAVKSGAYRQWVDTNYAGR